MKLTIISHTEHYTAEDGTIVGLGSTVTEINHLLEIFDDITHLAMLHPQPAPASALPYVSHRIHFVALPTVGGKQFVSKLNILWKAPKTLAIIHHYIKQTDYFQFRAPTGIGVFVIPYLVFFSQKKGWFKYAGHWKQDAAPLAYRFQRWLLLRQSRKITINGIWDDQPPHCLSFENPCLTRSELEQGKVVAEHKHIKVGHVSFCFVGRLEAAKGMPLFLEALLSLPEAYQRRIGSVHLVGEGPMRSYYEARVHDAPFAITFYGALNRKNVHAIYAANHFLVLPSASEGFPKVVSEAMNYGCIPIVSDVSSISQYLASGENAFLLLDLRVDTLVTSLKKALDLPDATYHMMAQASRRLLESFTYDYYNTRILNDLL